MSPSVPPKQPGPVRKAKLTSAEAAGSPRGNRFPRLRIQIPGGTAADGTSKWDSCSCPRKNGTDFARADTVASKGSACSGTHAPLGRHDCHACNLPNCTPRINIKTAHRPWLDRKNPFRHMFPEAQCLLSATTCRRQDGDSVPLATHPVTAGHGVDGLANVLPPRCLPPARASLFPFFRFSAKPA